MSKIDQQIKCDIDSYIKTVKFEFKVSSDWEPQTPGCWTECPFSVCTSIGRTCRALNDKTCPFEIFRKEN